MMLLLAAEPSADLDFNHMVAYLSRQRAENATAQGFPRRAQGSAPTEKRL
jgi:hypothetical protein